MTEPRPTQTRHAHGRTRGAVARTAACLLGLHLAACRATAGVPAVLDPGLPVQTRCGELVVDLAHRVTLLEDGALGLRYFPDRGVVALERRDGVRLLVTARWSTYLVEGSDVQRLERARTVLEPGAAAEFDNGYAGISGVYQHPDGRLFGFYHAEDHEVLPETSGWPQSFYASVGAAVSVDGGESWKKLGPVVTSAKPKTWAANERHLGRGAGFPSVVVSRDGTHLLLYYSELSLVENRGVQIFVARADLGRGAPLPGTFVKYFEASFSEPGLGGRESPVVSGLGLDESGAVMPYVLRSGPLPDYIMFFHVQSWKEHPDYFEPAQPAGRRSGLYVTTSADGLHWRAPCRLLADRAFPELGKSISWETGVVLDPGSETSGWLVYGYSPSWGEGPGKRPHYMVGRRIRMTRAPGPGDVSDGKRDGGARLGCSGSSGAEAGAAP